MSEEKLEKYGPGPWVDEPDHVEWRHAGFVCMIHRNEMGVLCGYVGVPEGHPWHGQGYDRVDAQVHGGLTYADHCAGHICHVPEEGEPDSVWWLGFDCAHAGDLLPRATRLFAGRDHFNGDTYKDVVYVKAEVQELAEQAAKAAS